MINWFTSPDDTEYDNLCGKDKCGYYWDVVNGVDGWVVYTAFRSRYVHDGISWKESSFARGLVGAVSREQAKLFAESLETFWD